MAAPAQLAGGDMVVHGIAVGDDADHLVVYELGIGVEVFVCRQFFLFGQFLPLFGEFGLKLFHAEFFQFFGFHTTDPLSPQSLS